MKACNIEHKDWKMDPEERDRLAQINPRLGTCVCGTLLLRARSEKRSQHVCDTAPIAKEKRDHTMYESGICPFEDCARYRYRLGHLRNHLNEAHPFMSFDPKALEMKGQPSHPCSRCGRVYKQQAGREEHGCK